MSTATQDAPNGRESAGKETGSARVYAQLRADILSVALKPGTPLDENSLSDRFGLSRSPIREALVRLSSEGLVQILANRSIVVAPIDFESVPQFLDALDLLQRVVTRSAARFRSEADLAEIKRLAAAYEVAAAESLRTGDSLPMTESNYAFHMAIARAGKNTYYSNFYSRILDEGRRILHFHLAFMLLDPEISVEKLGAGHAEMVRAIETHDLDAAERAAHEHALQFKGRFMLYLMQSVTPDVRLDGLGA